MEIELRLAILNQWYHLYEDFMNGIGVVCGKGCAACCTCNVTCTTLEGLLIYEHLAATGEVDQVADKASMASGRRYQPTLTINQMVEMCVHDLKLPEEENDPGAGPCPWLDHEICPIYAVRPFGCRAMCSIENCTTTGEAQMPPLTLSVNNVMMQYIEALDRPGGSGNLMDVLQFLSDQENHQGYVTAAPFQPPAPLKPNRPFPVLMIPPEHRQPLGPLLQAIQQAVKQTA